MQDGAHHHLRPVVPLAVRDLQQQCQHAGEEDPVLVVRGEHPCPAQATLRKAHVQSHLVVPLVPEREIDRIGSDGREFGANDHEEDGAARQSQAQRRTGLAAAPRPLGQTAEQQHERGQHQNRGRACDEKKSYCGHRGHLGFTLSPRTASVIGWRFASDADGAEWTHSISMAAGSASAMNARKSG